MGGCYQLSIPTLVNDVESGMLSRFAVTMRISQAPPPPFAMEFRILYQTSSLQISGVGVCGANTVLYPTSGGRSVLRI